MKEIKVKKHVYEWLANFYETDTNRITDLLECQIATTYLLIWPVMEQKLFSGFMKYNKISETAEKYVLYYNELGIENDVKYFYERYQNKHRYRNLKHNSNVPDVDNILNTPYDNLTSKQKLYLLFFVVYRYRNNIFHGSKGIESWTNYSLQIEKCISFMMKIVDCHEKHFI